MTDLERAGATGPARPAHDESAGTIVVAIIVNVLIAVCKITASSVTGSSAMLSESIHSAVDALNEALLFVGVSRAKRPADESHPAGYGQELYFWTLIVAVVIFGAGGSVSIFEGINRLLEPHPVEHLAWSYAVLGASLTLETVSWMVAYRTLRKQAGRSSTWRIIRDSKDPTVFTVLLEDSAAILGLVIALAGTFVQQRGFRYADGIASIGIGVVLCCVAFIVIRESRGLLIGESVSRPVRDGIRRIITREVAIARIEKIATLHFGPDNVLLILTLTFQPVPALEIAQALARIRDRVSSEYPLIKTLTLSLSSIAASPPPAEPATTPDSGS